MPAKPLDLFGDAGSVRWYRGLSRIQTGALVKLLHALRDDTEEGSAYRVRRCLFHLGLHPLVESAQLKAIMGISQGSDLAFLWFLWEASYKRPRGNREDLDPTPYTVNEQLLLSAIAHLDMPATLRALDAVLPPACQSKKPSPQCRNRPRRSTVRTRQSGHRDQPYFDRLERPRPFTPRGKYGPPETKVQFPDFLQYANKMLEIPNERGRWFAEYQLCPQKRVIKHLLDEELNRLISSQPPEEIHSLCQTHRLIEQLVMEQRDEVINRCISQLDVPEAELKTRRKSIVADLEREIQCAADKIREQSQRLLRQVRSIRNEGGSGSCQLCNSVVSTPRQCPRRKANLSILMMGHEDRILQYDEEDDEVKVMLLQGMEPHRCGAGDCKFIKAEDAQCLHRKEKPVQLDQKLENSKEEIPVVPPSITDEKLADRIPVCSRTLPCVIKKNLRPAPSQTFITRTVEGIMLDYNKVFDLPGIPEEHMPLEDSYYVDVEDKEPVIKKLCIAALNEGQSKIVKEFRQDEALSPVLRAAATCAVDMFRTKLAEAKASPEENKTIEVKKNEEKKVLIDPNNKQQIEDILKTALQKLRGNPHFVLATFPNAHKLPVLLDWVAHRYGKSFSQEEMNALAKSSFNIYERVAQDNRNRQHEALRLYKKIMKISGDFSYHNIKKFLSITRQRKCTYQKKLNESVLEQSRLIWLALRGYSHLGGQLKDTFFAYMPANEIDLKRDYMWKSSDYRDMVMDRRTIQNRTKLQNRRIA
ncbi:hypothetical protein KR054_003158 [Drosophila jambulina]|nr:hypothetical protein KR054_003158 [Drosophila jambulina]